MNLAAPCIALPVVSGPSNGCDRAAALVASDNAGRLERPRFGGGFYWAGPAQATPV
jgi:hypothetical protein